MWRWRWAEVELEMEVEVGRGRAERRASKVGMEGREEDREDGWKGGQGRVEEERVYSLYPDWRNVVVEVERSCGDGLT